MFINCPFDPEYRPIFEAVVFAVHRCGFVARCALEDGDSDVVRIAKILRMPGLRLGYPRPEPGGHAGQAAPIQHAF